MWTARAHGGCYSMLESHLRESKLTYSEVVAWEWSDGVVDMLDRTRCSV